MTTQRPYPRYYVAGRVFFDYETARKFAKQWTLNYSTFIAAVHLMKENDAHSPAFILETFYGEKQG